MSGRKQHYIPQSLLRGFASRATKDDAYVFCFQKDGRVFEPNTKNIAAERDFYSDPSNTLLDDAITEKEKDIADLLVDARKAEELTPGAANELRSLIAHLMSRTRVVRAWMSDSVQRAMEMMVRTVTDVDVMGAAFSEFARASFTSLSRPAER